MKLLIATDAWRPQVNGVVRTYENMCEQLSQMGHMVEVIHPQLFNNVPCPTYPDIKLAILPKAKTAHLLEQLKPDAIHIATEGPIGHAARSYCMERKIPFTTSFHTQFPEYLRLRTPLPLSWSYAHMRRFHKPAYRTMVPTGSQKQKLENRGFKNIVIWTRGVDTEVFQPYAKPAFDLQGPVFLYMGRVAIEKNIRAFLDLDLPGSKVVVGDGPDLEKLKREYKDVLFTGYKFGTELAAHIASANVFVFPSLTDTFGIVLLEAMASGVPVAAFPVTGPIDVVINGVTGVLDHDLKKAALAALQLNPEDCISYANKHSWQSSAETFISYIKPIHEKRIYTGNGAIVEYPDIF